LDYFTGCSNGYQLQQLDLIPEHMRDNFDHFFINFSLINNLQKSSIILESKIKILSSFLGTLCGDYFRQTKTAAKKEMRNQRIDPQHGASEHCSSWEDGRRNFEPPPTTESGGSFSWTGMLRAEFAENGKGKEPIRSEQSATLFMHVPISPKLVMSFERDFVTLKSFFELIFL
jgi:hypothetical protein